MTLRLNGSNSGFTEVKAPATAGSNTITLPTSNGSANQYLKNGSTAGMLEFGDAGKLVQFKSAEYTTRTSVTTAIPFDDTVPQNTEGTEIITLAITPTSTSNKLVIEFFMPFWDADSTRIGTVALFQDSTADALAVAGAANAATNYAIQLGMIHIMDAGTTSSTTFKIRVGPNAGTMYLNKRGDADYFGSTTLHTTLKITEVEV